MARRWKFPEISNPVLLLFVVERISDLNQEFCSQMAFNFGGGGAKLGFDKFDEQGGETKGFDPFDEKIVPGDLIDLGFVPGKHLVVDKELTLDCSKIHCYEAITIKDKGILTTEAYEKDKSSGILRIRCLGNVIIEKGGKIDVSGLGWKGGKNNGLSSDGIDVSGMSLGGKLGKCDKKPNHGGGGGVKVLRNTAVQQEVVVGTVPKGTMPKTTSIPEK